MRFTNLSFNILFLICFFCFGSSLYTEDWVGPDGGSWETAGNWSPATVPNEDTDNSTATARFTGNANVNFTTVNIQTLNVINGSDVNLTGTIFQFRNTTSNAINAIGDVDLTIDNATLAGPLTIQESGRVTLSNFQAFAGGDLNVEDVVSLTLSSVFAVENITIGSNATLSASDTDLQITGNGTFNFNNQGTTTLTNSSYMRTAGTGTVTFTNNGGNLVVRRNTPGVAAAFDNLTSTAAGSRIDIQVRPEGASYVDVNSTATIGRILVIALETGAYEAGDEFLLIDANTLNGEFDQVDVVRPMSPRPVRLSVSYLNNEVRATVLDNAVVERIPVSILPRNPRDVGQYFLENTAVTFASPDLRGVANTVLAINDEEPFAEALLRLSPLTEASNMLSSFQNDLQMAIVLDRQFQSNANKYRQKARLARQKARSQKRLDALEGTPVYAEPHSGVFIQPIGLFYNQRQTTSTLAASRQIPFWAYTYGAGIGYEHVFNEQFILEGGVGYTHSNLNWAENFGNSKWSSLYVAPFFGWVHDKAFANFMVMGAFNFYNTHRKIEFPGLERVAKSRYNSYDILLRGNGGMRFYLGEGLWFQPEATLNYLAIFTEGYRESGAGGLNLQVQRHTSYILQPSVRFRLLDEFLTPKFCYAPNIYLGWLANIPLDDRNITARFLDAPTRLFFNVQGERVTTNQLVLGAEFFARRFDQFELTSNFEADILSQFEVYTVKIKFEWLF